MYQEAHELISKHYDHAEGAEELYKLLNRKQQSTNLLKKLIELTELDRKYKLSKMPKTFEFTRTGNMFLHYIELFFAIIIS